MSRELVKSSAVERLRSAKLIESSKTAGHVVFYYAYVHSDGSGDFTAGVLQLDALLADDKELFVQACFYFEPHHSHPDKPNLSERNAEKLCALQAHYKGRLDVRVMDVRVVDTSLKGGFRDGNTILDEKAYVGGNKISVRDLIRRRPTKLFLAHPMEPSGNHFKLSTFLVRNEILMLLTTLPGERVESTMPVMALGLSSETFKGAGLPNPFVGTSAVDFPPEDLDWEAPVLNDLRTYIHDRLSVDVGSDRVNYAFSYTYSTDRYGSHVMPTTYRAALFRFVEEKQRGYEQLLPSHNPHCRMLFVLTQMAQSETPDLVVLSPFTDEELLELGVCLRVLKKLVHTGEIERNQWIDKILQYQSLEFNGRSISIAGASSGCGAVCHVLLPPALSRPVFLAAMKMSFNKQVCVTGLFSVVEALHMGLVPMIEVMRHNHSIIAGLLDLCERERAGLGEVKRLLEEARSAKLFEIESAVLEAGAGMLDPLEGANKDLSDKALVRVGEGVVHFIKNHSHANVLRKKLGLKAQDPATRYQDVSGKVASLCDLLQQDELAEQLKKMSAMLLDKHNCTDIVCRLVRHMVMQHAHELSLQNHMNKTMRKMAKLPCIRTDVAGYPYASYFDDMMSRAGIDVASIASAAAGAGREGTVVRAAADVGGAGGTGVASSDHARAVATRNTEDTRKETPTTGGSGGGAGGGETAYSRVVSREEKEKFEHTLREAESSPVEASKQGNEYCRSGTAFVEKGEAGRAEHCFLAAITLYSHGIAILSADMERMKVAPPVGVKRAEQMKAHTDIKKQLAIMTFSQGRAYQQYAAIIPVEKRRSELGNAQRVYNLSRSLRASCFGDTDERTQKCAERLKEVEGEIAKLHVVSLRS